MVERADGGASGDPNRSYDTHRCRRPPRPGSRRGTGRQGRPAMEGRADAPGIPARADGGEGERDEYTFGAWYRTHVSSKDTPEGRRWTWSGREEVGERELVTAVPLIALNGTGLPMERWVASTSSSVPGDAVTEKIKMRFICKKSLHDKGVILVKRIYKTTPTFSEHPDFRRLFSTRQIVPSRGRRP